MIEKVARAIAKEQGSNNWRNYLNTARVAVAAMSEASPDMLEAALPNAPDWGYLPDEWTSMIEFVAGEQVQATS